MLATPAKTKYQRLTRLGKKQTHKEKADEHHTNLEEILERREKQTAEQLLRLDERNGQGNRSLAAR